MKIYIIGYMGSGKTTVARKLASALNYKFIDLDEEITKAAKKSIPEIFEEEGEGSFRKREQQALHNTLTLQNIVAATGGGAPCFFDNMDWMNREGITVYLEATSKLLLQRLVKSKTQRPLLHKLSKQEMTEQIESHLALREQFYNQALIKIPAANINVNLLKEKIEKYVADRSA